MRAVGGDHEIKGFALADHAQLAAGMRFDGRAAVMQVGHFRFQHGVAQLQLGVGFRLLIHHLLQVARIEHPAVADPKPILQSRQDQAQDDEGEALFQWRMGYGRPMGNADAPG